MTARRDRDAGRLLRTVRHLRPVQLLGRPLWTVWKPVAHVLLSRAGNRSPPPLRAVWRPPTPELAAHVLRERARAAERLIALEVDPALYKYEATYARDAPARALRGEAIPSEPTGGAGLDPYPAAVRARSLALAVRLGAREIEHQLACAARATLAQLEWRLLGNHLLENAIGLACAGVACDGREARIWRYVGEALVTRELREQMLDDGGHFERSATYHGWIVAALLELSDLYASADLAAPPAWRPTIERALAWTRAVRAPDGTWPLFNDASLDACPSPDALIDLARALGFATPPPPTSAVRQLASTGWIVATIGDAFLVVDAGPVGPDYLPGHAHADSLSFELWADGRRLVVDPGVARYAEGPARAWSRATASHNTVAIDGADSSEVWGAFRVGRRASARVCSVAHDADRVAIVAEHDGYTWLPGRPLHRRTFVLRAGAIEITDELAGSGPHEAAFSLRFDSETFDGCGARVEANGTGEDDVWYPTHARPRRARIFTDIARGEFPHTHHAAVRWSH